MKTHQQHTQEECVCVDAVCVVASLTDGRRTVMVGLINTTTLTVTGSCFKQPVSANKGDIPCKQ